MTSFVLAGYWIILGASCLVAEFAVSGIGLLFLGLGGLTNAILVYNFTIFAQYQYASFGLISFAWLLILWLPLKKYVHRKNSKAKNYNDIIGSEVEVYSKELSSDVLGQVKWSGTIMNAKLDKIDTTTAKSGDRLHVKQIHGNVLICSK